MSTSMIVLIVYRSHRQGACKCLFHIFLDECKYDSCTGIPEFAPSKLLRALKSEVDFQMCKIDI